MFIDRTLLKASDISFFNKIEKLEILAFVRKQCQLIRYDAEIFCGIKERSNTGFKSNNSIQDGTYQKSLEDDSDIIRTLMKSHESSFIIYPGLIQKKLRIKYPS